MKVQFNEKKQAVPEETVPITRETFEKKNGTEIYWLVNPERVIALNPGEVYRLARLEK